MSTAVSMSDAMDVLGPDEREAATDLARAWEGNPAVRRRASIYNLALFLH